MCEPVTIAMGTAMIVGGVMKANAAQEQAGDESRQALDNKLLADVSAVDAQRRGGVEAAQARSETGKLIDRQRVAAAASGIDISSGSPLAVAEGTAMRGELDARTLELNAAREAWGYRTQGKQFEQEAKLARKRGDQAAQASILGGLGDAVGYAGKSYSPGKAQGGWVDDQGKRVSVSIRGRG